MNSGADFLSGVFNRGVDFVASPGVEQEKKQLQGFVTGRMMAIIALAATVALTVLGFLLMSGLTVTTGVILTVPAAIFCSDYNSVYASPRINLQKLFENNETSKAMLNAVALGMNASAEVKRKSYENMLSDTLILKHIYRL